MIANDRKNCEIALANSDDSFQFFYRSDTMLLLAADSLCVPRLKDTILCPSRAQLAMPVHQKSADL